MLVQRDVRTLDFWGRRIWMFGACWGYVKALGGMIFMYHPASKNVG